MEINRKILSVCGALSAAAVLSLGSSSGYAAVVPLSATQGQKTLTTTITFKVRQPDKLKSYIRATVTPGSSRYHKFLTVPQFVARYAPDESQIAAVRHYLTSVGIKVDKVYANHLAMKVSGRVSAFNRTFSTRVMNYEDTQPSHNPLRRPRFHKAASQPRIPAVLRKNGVLAIMGLSNEFKFRSMHASAAQVNGGRAKATNPGGNATPTGNQPQEYTVTDVAHFYNFEPLYEEGIAGQGMTVGVATYADFKPEDAYTYWNNIGLTVKPNRITKVDVDGGAPFGASAGSGETSLDVEQSGGLAPFANVVVYEAPNTLQAGLDMFSRIVSDNRVDTLSYSWGQPEIFYYPELEGGQDLTIVMRLMNQMFMEAAAQGISIFAASGDAGAFDTTRALPAPYYSAPFTVDAPSSSPYVTAAGGTTRPVTLAFRCGSKTPYVVQVPRKRAWAWDYLAGFIRTCDGISAIQGGIYSVGGGGGVSVFWQRPWYQDGIAGITTTKGSFNSLYEFDMGSPEDVLNLDGGFAGRNVPDVSMNADPESGYRIYSSADGGVITGQGGTSFVAPQLNGMVSLIDQRVGGRVGLLNAQLYGLLKQYHYGPKSPFNDITTGSNWGWQGQVGYDTATGVGTPNAARLAEVLVAQPEE